MNQQNPDVTLGDTTPAAAVAASSAPESAAPTGLPAGGAFGDPTPAGDPIAPAGTGPAEEAPREWTIEEILAMARLPEKRAHICLRADLEDRYQELLAELATLVDADGKPLDDDPERPVGGQSIAARALAVKSEADQVYTEMQKAMWHPLFRGMHSDDLVVFNKQHLPTDRRNGDFVEYDVQLIARCAVSPDLTPDRVRDLRKTLGTAAYVKLRKTAHDVCTTGGVDVPLSPSSWLAQER